MKKFLFDCGTRDPLASAGLLVLRAFFGLMMLIGHGIPKIGKFDALKDSWTVPGVWPLSHLSSSVSLMATIGIEVGAAAMLVLGLMTRPAAFALGFAMCVAAFQVHGAGPWFLPGAGAKEPALLYLAAAFTLIVTGAGVWSLDSPLSADDKRRRRRH